MMMNKKIMLLTAGLLGLGGLAAANTDFAFAEEVTDETVEEEEGVFDWMRERMGRGFQRFNRSENPDLGFGPGFGDPSDRSANGFMGHGMHGDRGPGGMFGKGPGAQDFQDDEWFKEREAFMQEQFEDFDPDMTEEEREAWFEEHSEWRREHFESMHPEWDEETLEEREAFMQEQFEDFDPAMTEEEREAFREERETFRNERRENNHHRNDRRPFFDSEE